MNEEYGISEDQTFKGIIVDLRLVVDQLGKNFAKAKDLIHELARHLDENKLCETDQVSRKIKKILKEEIKGGKITAKWIEDCLSPEYTRKYTPKSELSSLSKENMKEIEVDALGNSVVEPGAIPSSDSNNNDTINNGGSANEGANYTEELRADNELELESKSNEGNRLQSQVPNLDQEDRFFDAEFELPFEGLRNHMMTLLSKNNQIKSIFLIAKVDLTTKSLNDIRVWKGDGIYDPLN
ncbi:MAG TPA: hypothetical protein VH796_08780 [Nitrososphaeraceae archaeon]|jgi:hypothetical protein